MKKYLQLFYELFKISLFVIGGGYAIIAVSDQVFAKRKWTKEGELLEHLSIFQMIPGLIATHTAVYVGRKIAGPLGAAIGVFAVALPSIIIFTFVSLSYESLPVDNPYLKSAFVGLRSALTGIIAATLIRSWRRTMTSLFGYSVLLAALVALIFGLSVPLVLFAALLVGLMTVRPITHQSSPLALFLFLQYGLLCFGGGFVLVPMYIQDFVGPSAAFLQISATEFSNLIALTQLTPGPIGVNGATYFGFRLFGLPGAVIASIFLLLPGSVLAYLALSSLDRFRNSRYVEAILRGIRPASIALMLVALVAFAAMSIYPEKNLNTIGLILVILSAGVVLMKKMNIILLILLSAFVSLSLRAEDDVTRAAYPNADAVLVNEIDRVVYRPDGTYDEVDECWTKVLTEKGRREESRVTLRYSKRYGEGAILYVGVIDTNGVERVIDISKTMKESTDNSSMASNIYDPLDRRIVCTIPGLQIGETTHVKMRIAATSARCQGTWSSSFLLENFMPYKRAEIEITAPKELPIEKSVIRKPLGNVQASKRTLADGSTIHTFVLKDSPQAFPEPDMPGASAALQTLRISTVKDWPQISKWYWKISEPHLQKGTAEMTNKVAEVTTGLTSDEERMRAIFKFVSQEIRYMGLTMEDTSPGYAPHDIDITFNNRYGVCRDKTALLVALLRIGGFEAYPVLIHVGDRRDEEVPQPFFNHAIVGVVSGDAATASTCSYILMDPTNENAKDLFPAYESGLSYLVCRPEGEELRTAEVPPPDHNALRVASKGKLDKDGSLVLDSEIDFLGVNDTIYRNGLVKKTPEERVQFLERVVKALAPGAELVNSTIEPFDMRDTEKPIRVKLSVRFPEAILKGETRDELSIPAYSHKLGLVNYLFADNTALEKRRFALKVDATALGEEMIDIDLNGMVGEVLSLPEDMKIDGAFAFDRTFAVTNGHLYIHRRVAVTKIEIEPEEYPELRAALKSVEAAERKRPIFKENFLADADVRWIDDSTEVEIFSDKAWTEMRHIKKEVLTYKGKKNSAELKLGYNPAVEDVEIVSAVVSNRDGRVYAVSPKEINVMDCGWAGAAPRYPASKTIVVNLPSVEIGSTIAYTLRSSVTNAPAPFYDVYTFDSIEPLERRSICIKDAKIGNWHREVIHPKRLANEPGQPASALWRDQERVSRTSFGPIAALSDVRIVAPVMSEGKDILSIRNWMAKNVKVVGPDVWELPFELQLTDPEVVLKERYASPIDYVRTLAALLRGAGYDAAVVLAAADAGDPKELRRRTIFEHSNLRAFAHPLCRVTVKEGGFWGFGGVMKTYFLGTENEYAELGATAFDGSDYLDPRTGEFGVVTATSEHLKALMEEVTKLSVAEDGAVEMSVSMAVFGPDVAGFRRRFAEILPEDRSRYYQSLLAEISQAAQATSELKTDVVGYPAVREFSCRIPNYATVSGDAITLQLPALLSSIPTFTGKARKTPFALGAKDAVREEVWIAFPKGYTLIEHLPDPFVFESPNFPNRAWLVSEVKTSVQNDRLFVRLIRQVDSREYECYSPDMIELVKDRSRIASSRANRTIVVRKALKFDEEGEK